MVKELVRLSEKLFLMHAFVQTTVDGVNIPKIKNQDEKPKDQIFTLGPPFYKQMGIFHGIFYETLVDYI